jgi:hypothetical protein
MVLNFIFNHKVLIFKSKQLILQRRKLKLR